VSSRVPLPARGIASNSRTAPIPEATDVDPAIATPQLAAHDARIGPRALDPDRVAYAQIGIHRLRNADLVAISQGDHDVLSGPPFTVTVLHALANRSACQHSRYGRNGLAGAPADLMAKQSASDAADNRAKTKLVIAFERYRIDVRDTALTNFSLAQGRGLRAAHHEQGGHNGG